MSKGVITCVNVKQPDWNQINQIFVKPLSMCVDNIIRTELCKSHASRSFLMSLRNKEEAAKYSGTRKNIAGEHIL